VLLLNECLLLFISLLTQSGNFWIHPRIQPEFRCDLMRSSSYFRIVVSEEFGVLVHPPKIFRTWNRCPHNECVVCIHKHRSDTSHFPLRIYNTQWQLFGHAKEKNTFFHRLRDILTSTNKMARPHISVTLRGSCWIPSFGISGWVEGWDGLFGLPHHPISIH
jgi:hypothetical protein